MRASGKLTWSKPLRATTAPWIVDEELFVTRRGPRGKEQQVVVAVRTGALLREHHTSSDQHAADVPSSIGDWKTVWAFEGSRPVVERGVRYVAMGGEIHATDAESGAGLWQRRYVGSKQDRRSVGSVALAGAQIVIATRDGTLFGLDVARCGRTTSATRSSPSPSSRRAGSTRPLRMATSSRSRSATRRSMAGTCLAATRGTTAR
ncbi:MAG: PQQ-binding-like beta-propeller repeat protein [Deltaproteobacteria bacterium]|nr:PQQ-binding-like beta-propeller repeat protein [Deltaproteobacteria bacterium]